MKNKIIESILKAENEADKKQQSAREQSIKIIADAEEKVEKIKTDAQEEAKNILKTKLEQAENQAKETFKEELKRYESESNNIKAKAEQNFEKAIDVIVKRI